MRFKWEFYLSIHPNLLLVDFLKYDGMMKMPWVGWMTAIVLTMIEESPHSIEHDTGETPGRGNLSDRATETYRLETGKGEKVV